MGSPVSGQLPSFDPAVFLHSEIDDPILPIILPSRTNSDDLEALQLQQEEVTAAKTKQGIVIQHRAWKVGEVFRSEEDHHLESPLRKRIKLDLLPAIQDTPRGPVSPPSSPPTFRMAPISSPVAYPPSSSPPQGPRNKSITKTLDVISSNRFKKLGGFVMDDDDEDDDSALEAIKMARGEIMPGQENIPPPIQRAASVEDESQHSDFAEGLGTSTAKGSMHTPLTASLTSNTMLPSLVSLQENQTRDHTCRRVLIRTCSGKTFNVPNRAIEAHMSYEQLVASRSVTAAGRAKKSYYGIDIHQLLDENAIEIQRDQAQAQLKAAELPRPSIEPSLPPSTTGAKHGRTLMWTEKYRARKFTDLVGDERTHRSVLRWLKGWDPIVFPRAVKSKPLKAKCRQGQGDDYIHRKILLLTGPPGLGKTTLAHVCARQAGYEILEINASDERNRDVVKGRIRDSVGTENVNGVDTKTVNGKVRKKGRPVCVVVDEVDGVVGGSSGGGEGGFIKALIDLVVLDQKNTNVIGPSSQGAKKKKKGDNFRLLRPLILICNDVYHPALRPLRQSSMAEIIHIRKPPLNMVVSRMTNIFNKEGILCDGDGVRRLCEATWGVSSSKEPGSSASGTGEGDMRGIMVVGEWVASKLRASASKSLIDRPRLTRNWVEQHVLGDLAHGGGGARALGRGGAKEVVERVFKEGAGFPKPMNSDLPESYDLNTGNKVGVAELTKRRAMDRLREMVDTTGEIDRVVTDCFATYPTQPFQDDTLLSKPTAAYDYLHFHDTLSSKIFSGQEWELNPYLAQSVLAFHHLFASPARYQFLYSSTNNTTFKDTNTYENDAESQDPIPFTGPRADFEAFEAQKQNRAILLSLQASLSIPLLRMFRSAEEIATDLLPSLIKFLTPDVKPVIVGGSGEVRGTASVRKEGEKEMVRRSVEAMRAVGVGFERGRVDGEKGGYGGWVYRMEPPLDSLSTYATATLQAGSSASVPTRYAIRQVLDQEFKKESLKRAAEARMARYSMHHTHPDDAPFPLSSTINNTNNHNIPLFSSNSESKKPTKGLKRDFFGRVIDQTREGGEEEEEESGRNSRKKRGKAGFGKGGGNDEEGQNSVWVSFHEGFSNAVRKPIGLKELMRGL